MTQDEAARSKDAAGQNPPVPPVDERPRPRYGEYAPEGWTWQPPVDPNAVPDAATDASSNGSSATSAGSSGASIAPATVGAAATGAPVARPTDRLWTMALLVFGAFGVVYNILTLVQLPATALESAKLSSAMLGIDGPTTFTPGPAVPTIIAVGVVLQVLAWVGALLWSRARLRAGRLAWWIPLLAGVAAFVVVTIIGVLVFASDPAFLTSLSAVPQ